MDRNGTYVHGGKREECLVPFQAAKPVRKEPELTAWVHGQCYPSALQRRSNGRFHLAVYLIKWEIVVGWKTRKMLSRQLSRLWRGMQSRCLCLVEAICAESSLLKDLRQLRQVLRQLGP